MWFKILEAYKRVLIASARRIHIQWVYTMGVSCIFSSAIEDSHGDCQRLGYYMGGSYRSEIRRGQLLQAAASQLTYIQPRSSLFLRHTGYYVDNDGRHINIHAGMAINATVAAWSRICLSIQVCTWCDLLHGESQFHFSSKSILVPVFPWILESPSFT